jgi:hypothetical protein
VHILAGPLLTTVSVARMSWRGSPGRALLSELLLVHCAECSAGVTPVLGKRPKTSTCIVIRKSALTVTFTGKSCKAVPGGWLPTTFPHLGKAPDNVHDVHFRHKSLFYKGL